MQHQVFRIEANLLLCLIDFTARKLGFWILDAVQHGMIYSQLHHHTPERCANNSLSHDWFWRCTYWSRYCFILVPPHSQTNILWSVQWQRERPIPPLTILNYLCGIKSFVDPHAKAWSQGLFWICKIDLGCTILPWQHALREVSREHTWWVSLPQNTILHSFAYKL